MEFVITLLFGAAGWIWAIAQFVRRNQAMGSESQQQSEDEVELELLRAKGKAREKLQALALAIAEAQAAMDATGRQLEIASLHLESAVRLAREAHERCAEKYWTPALEAAEAGLFDAKVARESAEAYLKATRQPSTEKTSAPEPTGSLLP